MRTHADRPSRYARLRLWVPVPLLFLTLSVGYTWPLLRDARTLIASDPGDPILTTSILWWNATTWPFSEAWWNAPHYYPSEGIAAFTEHLVGLMPTSTPILWATGNPILAHNIAFFLTWPLSALSAYLLVRLLTQRDDAAIVAGIAFAFSPYRATELAHIHMLAFYWMPMALLGLHGYVADGRARWLWMFGASWILVSLSNLYFMLFGGVLLGLWLSFFCSTRRTWCRGGAVLLAWAAASLPLVPIVYKYRVIHDNFGLRRSANEALYFSASPQSWAQTSPLVWLWGQLLPIGKDNLFPGLTAGALVLTATAVWLLKREALPADRALQVAAWRRRVRPVLAIVTALSVTAILVALSLGPWSLTITGIVVRVSSLDRAITLTGLAGVSWVLLTPRCREALGRRSPFIFYAAATLAMAILCCGPSLRVGDQILFAPAPYAWLMKLPGFDGVRVPTRFWMPGILCLSVAAGLAFDALRPTRRRLALAMSAAVAACLLAEGWVTAMPMAQAFEHWPAVEPAGRREPILELPLGPYSDWGATFRAAGHRRRVVNGVSGYDPPHYNALRVGLEARDPAILSALTSLGPLDVVVNGAQDADGAFLRYASSAAGAAPAGSDGVRTLFRLPPGPAAAVLGAALPIARAYAIRHDTQAMHDGRIDTGWGDIPQQPGQWIGVDLGRVQLVGGVTQALGEYYLDFPRRLSIEVSADGEEWEPVWEGSAAPAAFLAFARGPREGAMRFAFAPRPARYVRLLQLAHASTMWRVSEIIVHAPR